MMVRLMEHLFSYGTLQYESVQYATFGRKLEGRPDRLAGYSVTLIPIQDEDVTATGGDTHYRNVRFTGRESDLVEGMAFKVTMKELAQADAYEAPAGYKRVAVRLASGLEAWVYLNTDQ
jgi:hypothetical protein